MVTLASDRRPSSGLPQSRRRLIRNLSLAWIIIAAIFVAWETWTYSGLYAKISEWEFASIHKSWPAATFGILLLLLALPGVLALFAIQPKKDEEEREHSPSQERQCLIDKAIRWHLWWTRGAIVCAGLAVICIFATLFLPTKGSQLTQIIVGQEGQQRVANGGTTITGRVIFAQTATLGQDLILTDRIVRFAPMQPAESGIGPIRYVVQLMPDEGVAAGRATDPVMSVSGILVRGALPGPVRTLYRNSGMALADDVHVLYRYPGTMRRPFYLAAAQCGTIALVLLLLSYLQMRHIKTMRNRFDESDKASSLDA
jgi:hypothetical protein